MRLTNIETDYWELRSAEEAHKAHPDRFWIPPIKARKTLKRGDAAKLIFDIESQDENGQLIVTGERMWVIIAEVTSDGYYLGILDSKPASFDPSENVYLCFGAEVLFSAEHIIDIGRPPQQYIDWQLGQAPERKWPYY